MNKWFLFNSAIKKKTLSLFLTVLMVLSSFGILTVMSSPSAVQAPISLSPFESSQYSFSSITLPSNWATVTALASSQSAVFLGGSSANGDALFGYYTVNGDFEELTNSLPSDLTQLHTIAYGGGDVLIGGQNGSGASLVVYQISSGNFIDLTQSLRSQISASLDVNGIAYDGSEFLIGGATNWYSLIGFYTPGSNSFQSLQSNIPGYFASNAVVWDGKDFLIAGAGVGPGGSPGTPPKLGYITTSGTFKDISNLLPSDVGVMWSAAFDGTQILIGAQNSNTGNLVLFLFNQSTQSFKNVTMNFPPNLNMFPLSIANYTNGFIIGGEAGNSEYLAIVSEAGNPSNISQAIPTGTSNIRSVLADDSQVWAGGSYSNGEAFFGVSNITGGSSLRQATVNLLPYYGNVANLPVVGTAATQITRFVYTSVGLLTMSPDLWDVSDTSVGNITMSAGEVAGGDVTAQIHFTDVTDKGLAKFAVTGYPSLSYGFAVNGGTVSTGSPSFELPNQMNNFSSLRLTTSYSVAPHSTPMDFSYDIWITKANKTLKMTSNDVELMLYLYDANDMTFGWSLFGKGTYTTPGIVDGVSTTITWTTYAPPTGGTGAKLVIFAITGVGTGVSLKNATVSIDLMDLWPDVESVLNNLGMKVNSSYYLENIDLGSEFEPENWWLWWDPWSHPTADYSFSISQYSIKVEYI
jgi:hypothetical protein